jgi:hypothetical protein
MADKAKKPVVFHIELGLSTRDIPYIEITGLTRKPTRAELSPSTIISIAMQIHSMLADLHHKHGTGDISAACMRADAHKAAMRFLQVEHEWAREAERGVVRDQTVQTDEKAN